MTSEILAVTATINAPAERIFAVLADPSAHATIDGTGWVQEPIDREPLRGSGQIFKMGMYHPNHPNGRYEMANRILVCDPPHVISWEPGYDVGDGTLHFGGWSWRYDLAPRGRRQTDVTLTYDWSSVPKSQRQNGEFPPFPPEHLGNSLDHLGEIVIP